MFYKNKYGTWKYTIHGGMINNDSSDEDEDSNDEEVEQQNEDEDSNDEEEEEEEEEPIVRFWNADDYRYASSNRPRFAEIDRLMDRESYHIETYEDDDGNMRQRRVRTKDDIVRFNKLQEALYNLGYYH